MAKKPRQNPALALANRQVSSTYEMARLAKESGYQNVAMNLTNLAQRRKTARDRLAAQAAADTTRAK